jgi:hypothetical protein
MKMKNPLILAKYPNFFAILTPSEINSGDFMADTKDIYEAPEIDGFIGFLKVIACTEKKGNLPLLDKDQISIPETESEDRIWVAHLETDEEQKPIVTNGFVNLIGIKIPQKQ